MAIIAGNFDLAEIIKTHKASDVGKWLVYCTSTIINCYRICKQAQTIPCVNESLQTLQSAMAMEHENESGPLCVRVFVSLQRSGE